MRPLHVISVLLTVILCNTDLRAELDERDIGYWRAKAKECGITYQILIEAKLGHLMPSLKDKTLTNATIHGASESQIDWMSIWFDEGRELVVQKVREGSLNPRPPADNAGRQEIDEYAKFTIMNCTEKDITFYDIYHYVQ